VQLLLYATYASGVTGATSATGAMGATGAVAVLIALTLLQAGVGTQVRGAVDHALDSGIARELAIGTVGRLDFIHRDLAFVVLMAATVVTLWLLSKRSALVSWAFVVLALAGLQIAVGLYMAYGYLLPAAQVAHLTLSSLLLGAETVLWLNSRSRTA
ncbi:MAG: hypothetical protein ACKOEC_09200, partial [Acidimicrobiia bacterium]